jgi:hypothetical protein
VARQPKDFEYRAEYEPDMARMVKALRVLLDFNPGKENDHGTGSSNIRQVHEVQPDFKQSPLHSQVPRAGVL